MKTAKEWEEFMITPKGEVDLHLRSREGYVECLRAPIDTPHGDLLEVPDSAWVKCKEGETLICVQHEDYRIRSVIVRAY